MSNASPSAAHDHEPHRDELEQTFSIWIKKMNGNLIQVGVRSSSSVAQVKRLLPFPAYAQRLAVIGADGDPTILEDDCLIGKYDCIQRDSVIALIIIENLFTGGEMMRIFGGMYEDCADVLDRMYLPRGICLSLDSSRMFVADTVHNCIQVRSFDRGTPITRLHGSDASMRRPHIVRMSSDGQHLFVVVPSNNHVKVLRTADDRTLRLIGSSGARKGELRNPHDAVLLRSADAADELLFVADSGNDRVQVFRAADGEFVRSIGSFGSGPGKFDCPRGICLSADQELLFVSERNNHRVQVLRARDGDHVKTIGSEGSADGQFNGPWALCVSFCGEWLFVADAGNHRIQVFSTSAFEHVKSISSFPSSSSSELHPACDSIWPGGLCASPAFDAVYISDVPRNRVIEFTSK